MNPFSPLFYLKRNMKSVLPVFVSIAIGVFLVYFYALFSATTTETVAISSLNLAEKYSMAYSNNNTVLPSSFLKKLDEADGSGVIAVQFNMGSLRYANGMGNANIQTYNIFSDDTARLLKGHDVKLVAGRLPRDNQKEILVPRKFAVQNHVGVGDEIGSQVSDTYQQFPGKYKICGLLDGSVLLTVACEPGKLTKEQIKQCNVIYPVEHLSKATQNDLLKNLPSYIGYSTYDTSKDQLTSELAAMQSLTFILTGMMIIILCIALSNLNAITFANRKEEFGILNAIGYTKGRLACKLWAENVLICIVGYATGIGLTIFAAWVLNSTILFSQGKELVWLDLPGMLSSLAMPVFVSFFSLLPCLIHNFSKHSDFSM